MYLSKSKYCLGVRCPKMMWLSLHLPKTDEEDRDDQEQKEAAALARGTFGTYETVPYGNLDEMAAQTRRLLDQGVELIAEASFAYDGCFCSVDMLKNLGGNRVEIYEIKCVKNLKPKHRQDAAFQNYVLTKLGYQVERVYLVALNGDYERRGPVDAQQLFTRVDVTKKVNKMLPEVESRIPVLKPYLDMAQEPQTQVCNECFVTSDECEYPEHCYRHLEEKNLIHLHGMDAKHKTALYQQGLRTFRELESYTDLGDRARMQIDHELHDQPPHIDAEAVRADVKALELPLYFLDFETFMSIIPPYDKTGPNEAIPFQYSLHYLAQAGQEPVHCGFLGHPETDPRRALAEQLCRDIPLDARIVAYHSSVEKNIVLGLAELFPDLKAHLEDIAKNILEMETAFEKLHYYARRMEGSYSIKYVLPALYPALSYSGMEVSNGQAASKAFLDLKGLTGQAKEDKRKHLWEYCKLDTLAMVRLWEKLQEV